MEILFEKAMMLGFSDVDNLPSKKLELEVHYASLSREARNNLERGQVSRIGFSRLTLPDPVYISRGDVIC